MSRELALHSVSYAGLWGQAFLNVEDFVSKAAELGYSGVMLMAKRPHLSVLDYGDAERARLRSHLEKRRIHATCVAGYTNFTADLEHGDIPHREIQIQHVVELARMARDLGCTLVRVFTGYDHPSQGYTAQWKIVVEALRECARRAALLGVTIGVQNHHDIAVGFESHADLIANIDEPNCKALFDAWAPALHGVDINAAARLLGPMTAHTTIANYVMRPRYRYDPSLVNYRSETPAIQAVPMRDGFIDYSGFLASLYESGFDGSIAYEMCSPLRDGADIHTLDSYARGFLEYMDEFYGKRSQAAR
jgi:sugar phosphate isomerase/epimerase